MKRLRELWDKFVAWLLALPVDKRFHYVIGELIAAYVVIALHLPRWGLAAAVVGGILKELFDWITTRKVEHGDLLWTSAGGLTIQLFVIIGYFIDKL